MNHVKLIIDNRENDLKKFFPESETVEYQNMEIGDMKYTYQGKTFLLIERKTLPDLIASVNDGRYREQKLRIKHQHIPPYRVMYLLEGELMEIPGNSKTYYGMVINTLMRDKFYVFRTFNTEETVQLMSRIKIKLETDPKKIIGDLLTIDENQNEGNQNNQGLEGEYLESIKLKKKDNMTPRMCSILQLSQIPGCSRKVATIIIDKFETIVKIIQAVSEKEIPKDKIKVISELTFSSKNAKNEVKERKIGPVLGERIITYLGLI